MARDALKQKLLEKVDQLDDFLTQKTRRTKISKMLDECIDLQHQIAEKTAKLTENEGEAFAGKQRFRKLTNDAVKRLKTYEIIFANQRQKVKARNKHPKRPVVGEQKLN